MPATIPLMPTRGATLVRFGLLSLAGVALVAACTNPLRVNAPGTAGMANSGGAAGTGGTVGAAGTVGTAGGGGGITGTGGRVGSGGSIGTTGTTVSTCPNDVDTQTDNHNCGACGIACTAPAPSKAQCTAGRCLVTLASGQPLAFGIAVDATSAYWTNYNGDAYERVVKLTPK